MESPSRMNGFGDDNQGLRFLEVTPAEDGGVRSDTSETSHKSNVQLKQFIAEHKREMRALRSNKLFQDFFKSHGGQRRASPTKRLVADDSDHSMVSTLDLIRKTAEKQGRPMEGVWSAFGQPYAPLGVPTQASKNLPPLNRDEINGVAPEPHKQPTGMQNARNTRVDLSGAGTDTRASSRGPGLVGGEETILCWASKDEIEVRFPKEHIKLGQTRQRKAMAGSSFVDEAAATREAAPFMSPSPEAAAPQPEVSRDRDAMNQPPRESLSRSSSRSRHSNSSHHSDEKDLMLRTSSKNWLQRRNSKSDSKSEVMMSDTASNQGDVVGALGEGSDNVGDDDYAKRPFSSRSAVHARAQEAANNPAPPKPPVLPMKNHSLFANLAKHKRSQSADNERASTPNIEGNSPVVQWRKEFLDVRRQMQATLTEKLAERAGRRAMARSSPHFTMAVATQLMDDMNDRSGKLSPVPGSQRVDSWRRAEIAMHAQDQPKKVDVSEIQSIEKFYEKLCHLVERQRVSDPLSLSIVHKVKHLLECGVSMQKMLLVRVCEHLRTIYQLGGADNPYVLPIIHFVRQSVHVSVEDLETLLKHMGLGELLKKGGNFTSPSPLQKSSTKGPPLPPGSEDTHGEKSRMGGVKLDYET
mmetsp:Transcript_23841/g.28798  ORF Transcript_23841/g.28798 Transcript_23841/m.28798 type:complete len:638 (+) Transcript_23841:415-2328(+)|eukprot:CAMPEP_0197864672 /NCGR_PEP_ID=MMETSP1438-20131217/43088_1 /TAXON_ID=1461541 /ORGANISM="Pterosperma sp., Strain CCMP1384" /LENGTH=637 /DNA_ID=CAMNT_0043483007 /DNA_START=412 /DNA_END=2325 /DNA_ORIENTATION=-